MDESELAPDLIRRASLGASVHVLGQKANETTAAIHLAVFLVVLAYCPSLTRSSLAAPAHASPSPLSDLLPFQNARHLSPAGNPRPPSPYHSRPRPYACDPRSQSHCRNFNFALPSPPSLHQRAFCDVVCASPSRPAQPSSSRCSSQMTSSPSSLFSVRTLLSTLIVARVLRSSPPYRYHHPRPTDGLSSALSPSALRLGLMHG